MWPLGEPGEEDFRFCEAPATAGKPYCSAHCDRFADQATFGKTGRDSAGFAGSTCGTGGEAPTAA